MPLSAWKEEAAPLHEQLVERDESIQVSVALLGQRIIRHRKSRILLTVETTIQMMAMMTRVWQKREVLNKSSVRVAEAYGVKSKENGKKKRKRRCKYPKRFDPENAGSQPQILQHIKTPKVRFDSTILFLLLTLRLEFHVYFFTHCFTQDTTYGIMCNHTTIFTSNSINP